MMNQDEMDVKPEFTCFTIDCDPQSESDKYDINYLKSAPVNFIYF